MTAINSEFKRMGVHQKSSIHEDNETYGGYENSIDIKMRIEERQKKIKKSISGYTYFENQEIEDTIRKL